MLFGVKLTLPVVLGNSAGFFRVRGLRIRAIVGIVIRIILLLLSGLMLLIFGPGVSGSSPSAICLDGHVVLSSDKLHETIDTPVGSPRVSDEPVGFASLLIDSITDNGNIVDNVHVA